MPDLRLVLGDQLTASLSALRGADRSRDIVVMFEVSEETSYVRHHKQKIVLVLSAMRHFAEELRAEGFAVDYVKLDDPQNAGSITAELKRAVRRHRAARIVATEPGEWRVRRMMRSWEMELGVPVEIREDTRFLCSLSEFALWAENRRHLPPQQGAAEIQSPDGTSLPDAYTDGCISSLANTATGRSVHRVSGAGRSGVRGRESRLFKE